MKDLVCPNHFIYTWECYSPSIDKDDIMLNSPNLRVEHVSKFIITEIDFALIPILYLT